MSRYILFTARDVGAAHQIKYIAEAFRKRGYKISVFGSGLAFEIFKKKGLNPTLFSFDGKTSSIKRNHSTNSVDELLKSSYKILSREKPDAVFCGLSTEGYGLDEAVLYWASPKRLNIPSFQFLDAWGTFNHLLNGHPNIYFAIDKATKKFSFMGAKAPIEVVGSPRHYVYQSKPIDLWRERTRKKLCVTKNEKLIGFFGQNPEVYGEVYNFRELISALKKYNKQGKQKCKLLLRPHPAYIDKYEFYPRYLKDKEIELIASFSELDIEEILSACDVITTCYSTIAVDHAYLSRYANRPIGVAIYLLSGVRIKKYLNKNFGYWKNPLLERGIGYCATTPKQLFEIIEYVLENPKGQIIYFRSTKSLSNDDPCKKIIKVVTSLIS